MKNMRKLLVIPAAMAAMSLAAIGPVDAGGNASDDAAESQSVIQIFDTGGEPASVEIGTSDLIRGEDFLEATVKVTGLERAGLYTFWWVVIPEGKKFPEGSFVAKGAARAVGSSGNATVRMTASELDQSIEGFSEHLGNGECGVDDGAAPCFAPLDFDLSKAEVHVEIAYHGDVTALATDPSISMADARADFWTGIDCPIQGSTQADTQPHCPVSYVAVHEGPAPSRGRVLERDRYGALDGCRNSCELGSARGRVHERDRYGALDGCRNSCELGLCVIHQAVHLPF